MGVGVGVGWYVNVHALQKRSALQDAVFNISEDSKRPKLTGTRCLDQAWNQLKKFVPKELRSRDLKSHRDNSRLTTYVLAFMLRWNARPHLLKAVGSLAKKASR